jgi:hypothetical protein
MDIPPAYTQRSSPDALPREFPVVYSTIVRGLLAVSVVIVLTAAISTIVGIPSDHGSQAAAIGISFASLALLVLIYAIVLPRRITITRDAIVIRLLFNYSLSMANIRDIAVDTQFRYHGGIKFVTDMDHRCVILRAKGFLNVFVSPDQPAEFVRTARRALAAYRSGHAGGMSSIADQQPHETDALLADEDA